MFLGLCWSFLRRCTTSQSACDVIWSLTLSDLFLPPAWRSPEPTCPVCLSANGWLHNLLWSAPTSQTWVPSCWVTQATKSIKSKSRKKNSFILAKISWSTVAVLAFVSMHKPATVRCRSVESFVYFHSELGRYLLSLRCSSENSSRSWNQFQWDVNGLKIACYFKFLRAIINSDEYPCVFIFMQTVILNLRACVCII